MKKYLFFTSIFVLGISSQGIANPSQPNDSTVMKQIQKEEKPEYLYKVLSLVDWNNSQSKSFVILSKEDKDFIHLSKQDQLDKIIDKYWSNVPEFVVLKLDTHQLPGNLVYETNPGGTHKYYHLYSGSIPLSAIVEVKKSKSKN